MAETNPYASLEALLGIEHGNGKHSADKEMLMSDKARRYPWSLVSPARGRRYLTEYKDWLQEARDTHQQTEFEVASSRNDELDMAGA